jgi:CubicO group peptidase (beta-lactamase class C family)
MRQTVKIGRAICIIFLLSAINQIQAQSADPIMVTNTMEESIDEIFKDFNAITKPGAAVAVMQHGEIVFKKGYGSANMEYDIPVTPSTIFHVASVSKQFTVYSILL